MKGLYIYQALMSLSRVCLMLTSGTQITVSPSNRTTNNMSVTYLSLVEVNQAILAW